MGKEFALQLDRAFSGIDEFWLVARRKERLEELAGELQHKVRILPMDVTDEVSRDQLAKLLRETGAIVRMLINAAGFGLMGQVSLQSREELGEMLELNCLALTDLTKLCLPFMKRGSRILQLASAAAFLPQPDFAVYAATKAYVLSFSRALNMELKNKGIYVTAVCPGPVKTEFFDRAEKYRQISPMKKKVLADPAAVVSTALRDSGYKRPVSVYGLPMKGLMLAAKYVPQQMILEISRFIK